MLDRGFVLRSEAESFLRMTPEEQRIAAQMLQQLYAIAYNGPGSAAIQDEKKAIRGRFVDALRTVADTSSMQDAHEALVAAVFTVQKEMACLKETIRKVKTIPPEQPAAQVEQTEVIREVREKTAVAKAQEQNYGQAVQPDKPPGNDAAQEKPREAPCRKTIPTRSAGRP